MKESLFEQFNKLLADEDPQIHDYVEHESDIVILQDDKEYDIQLVFASTTGHGYYGAVNGLGELMLVGEEDEGIQEKFIMDIFEVDEYGRKKE